MIVFIRGFCLNIISLWFFLVIKRRFLLFIWHCCRSSFKSSIEVLSPQTRRRTSLMILKSSPKNILALLTISKSTAVSIDTFSGCWSNLGSRIRFLNSPYNFRNDRKNIFVIWTMVYIRWCLIIWTRISIISWWILTHSTSIHISIYIWVSIIIGSSKRKSVLRCLYIMWQFIVIVIDIHIAFLFTLRLSYVYIIFKNSSFWYFSR